MCPRCGQCDSPDASCLHALETPLTQKWAKMNAHNRSHHSGQVIAVNLLTASLSGVESFPCTATKACYHAAGRWHLLKKPCCWLLPAAGSTSRHRQKREPKIAVKNHVKCYHVLHKKHANMPPVAGLCSTQKEKTATSQTRKVKSLLRR